MSELRSTRSALLMSMLALLLCFVMLLGTTFAWFTDSVTSSGNKISSGTLKIDLELLEKDGTWNSIKESNAPIFDYEQWEPGYTDVKILKVENEGTLALKWMAKFISENELSELADVIDVYVLPSASELAYPTDGSLAGYVKVGTVADFVNTIESTTTGVLSAGEVAYLGIALKMDGASVGNDYQGLDLSGSFDITILATQLDSEKDSFGSGYDADAEYPTVEIVVDRGSACGINWTITNVGTLRVSPSSTSTPDINSGKVFEPGAWREAVVYNSQGQAQVEGFKGNYAPDAGGYFCDRNAVTSLVIEEGVTMIGSFAAQFPNLTGELVIPASVTYIGQEAFQNCKITKLTFAKGGTEPLCIAPGAFKNLAIEELVLPDDRPIEIHCWAFNNCKSLKRVTLPASITAFAGWTHAEYYGKSWVYGKYATSSDIFSGCTALESITFGSQEVQDKFNAAQGNAATVRTLGVSTEIQ